MKMNKKITASVLAMTMGAGLVGSISGTVAWYQYSTRAQLGMFGMSLGLDRNLEAYVTAADVDQAPAKSDTNWTSNITDAKIKTFLGLTKDYEFNPITTNAGYAKDGDFGSITFKGNPIKYKTNPNQWAAAQASDYLEFKLWVRAVERDGTDAKVTEPDYVQKALGLYDARIQTVSVTGKKDISDAVRVQITAGTNYAVMSKKHSQTNLYGPLDVDLDGILDTEIGYSDVDVNLNQLTYGLDSTKGYTYSLESEAGNNGQSGALYCDDPIADSGTNAGKQIVKGGLYLGETSTSAPASFIVRVWLEGWAKLGAQGAESAMWSTKDYVGSRFFVGLTVASGEAYEAA